MYKRQVHSIPAHTDEVKFRKVLYSTTFLKIVECRDALQLTPVTETDERQRDASAGTILVHIGTGYAH